MTMSVTPRSEPYDKAVAGRTAYVILHNTSEVVTPDPTGTRIERYPRGAVVFRDGRVLDVGTGPDLLRRHGEARPINAYGHLVTPGLVDCHTHMIFAGHRAAELQRKLAGESYAQIAAAGGGIRSTVEATTAERDDVLEKSLSARLERWRASGCTTVEVKTGYGLTPRREVRLLEVVRGALQRVPVRVQRTALLLHALPEEYRTSRDAYIEEMCEQILPEIRERGLAEAIDAFCDPMAFTVEECRGLLRKARDLGLGIKLHAEQTQRSGGALLAAELGALSVDHLESAEPEDWEAIARSGTVGVLLPIAALTLGQTLPRASKLRASGARVAIATDFNPGTAAAQSLLECAALAARLCGFDADETLLAITWNAAKALGLEERVGHLNPGAWGDAVVWECETLEELPYWMPATRPDCTFIRGADLALPTVERRVWP
jgi:imidazolonepropionase